MPVMVMTVHVILDTLDETVEWKSTSVFRIHAGMEPPVTYVYYGLCFHECIHQLNSVYK